MRFLSLVFAMAPIAVLGSNNTMGRGSRGGRCCDRGIEDPTGACAIIGYNSYGVSYFFFKKRTSVNQATNRPPFTVHGYRQL